MSMRLSDIEEAIKRGTLSAAEAFKGYVDSEVKRTLGDYTERLEELESRAKSPGKTGRGDAGPTRFRTYFTESGIVYELPADVKMVEAIPPVQVPDVSLDRWLAAAVLGEKCRDRQAVEFALATKQLTGGTEGVLIPEQFISTWIDNLRARMVLSQAGLSIVTMTDRTQTHSRVLSDPTVAWRAEGGTLTPSAPTFELAQLVAKSIYTRVQGTAELAADSPSFGQQLMDVMLRSLAVAIDAAGLRGLGASNQPQGVLGADGVNRLPNVGTITNYDPFVDAVGMLWDANVPEDAVGAIVVSPSTLRRLRKLKTGLSGDQSPLAPPPGLPRFLATTSLENGDSPPTSTAIVGDWSDLTLGIRREAHVETLRVSSYASNLLLEYVAWARLDFMIRRPASFTTIEDINN